MLRVTYSAFWAMLLGLILSPSMAADLKFGPGTILIYENLAGEQKTQFILRLARFRPDIVLEWESVSHQGTIHLYSSAVEKAKKLTIGALFDPGIDLESKDQITKWLPRSLFADLISGKEARIHLNRSAAKLKLSQRGRATLTVDKQEVEVPTVYLEDNRDGKWCFYDNPSNPVLIEYETTFYRETLKVVATGKEKSLRWIRTLPPVK